MKRLGGALQAQGQGLIPAFLKDLITAGLLQLGMELQCPLCTKHAWYSFTDLDYAVKCHHCRQGFDLPTQSPRELTLSYRTPPPFGDPGRADGAVAVLLTLSFFTRTYMGSTTPLLSFNIRKSGWSRGRSVEVDLGLLRGQWGNRASPLELVLAECKMFGPFKKKDVSHMIQVTREFAGCAVVFTTLNSQLSANERKLIRPLAERAIRDRSRHRPFTRVVVLTCNEVCSDWPLEIAWDKLGGEYTRMARLLELGSSLTTLAEATQKLYLDIDPWKWKRPIDPRDVAEVEFLSDDIDGSATGDGPVSALRVIQSEGGPRT